MSNIIKALQNQYLRDIEKQKGVVKKDLKQHFLHWNEKRNVFLGIDENGIEWIAGVDTDVPVYWEYCPSEIQYVKNGQMRTRKCRTPHLIPIFDDGKLIKCVQCGHEFTVNIELPDDAPQKQLLDNIRSEK